MAAALATPISMSSIPPTSGIGLPPEIEAILKKPLPPEAIGDNPNVEGLSSINGAFVIERLNDAFGIGGWKDKVDIVERDIREETWKRGTDRERKVRLHVTTVHVTFTVERFDIHKENFGGGENEDLGDSLKGARTGALKKIGSELGIGLDVYKSGRSGGGGSKDKAREPLPTCPYCKIPAIIKGKAEYGGGYLCWTKKDGCGAKFTEEEYANAREHEQFTQKKTQSASSPASTDPEKASLSGVVSDLSIEGDTLWMTVGDKTCATKSVDLMKPLQRTKGKLVELQVSKIESAKHGTIWMIHRLIGWKAV